MTASGAVALGGRVELPREAVLLTTALGPCLFGTAFLATAHLPGTPVWNAVYRVLPAGLLLLAVRPALPGGVWWARSILLGALNFGGFFALQAVAAHRLPGAVVATISAAQCLVVPVLVIALGQRVGNRDLWAPPIGLTGVALLLFEGETAFDMPGVLAAAGLALLSATGMVLTRRWGTPPGVHPLSATAWQMTAGGLLLLPIAALADGAPPRLTLAQLSLTVWLSAAATALAFALFFGGLHRGVPATTASRLMLQAPVVATALGWTLAHETLRPPQLAGILLVLTAQLAGLRTRDPARAP
ncbi:putative blue pigment (indigoidine) exporter [Nocardia transvalensis]|uniref:Putative blue pigment (Indigoidine) exporter n=1 Tax=Nocardia transvalensis TaxID=37333 RepID=A0A7W9PFQ7_9NOCA|nr:EamA family transporter [Nocardia transvalensis]MBB5915354.1 putative blue pigment (indigoidine) exporter [Nocardia transvalensis]